jgi:hypothetical protein
MVPLHRRSFLRAAVGGASATLTGCSTRSSPPTATPTRRPGVEYDALFVRNPTGEPFVTYTDDDGETESDPVSTVLYTADDADRVSFRRGVDGVDDARRFLADTDFSDRAVLLREHPVGECRALLVDSVVTSEDSFDVDFCRRLRPADVECSTDRRDVVLSLVRVPYAGEPTSYTVGSGGSCERRPPGEEP